MRTLKVWGGFGMDHGCQNRLIVAGFTKKQAFEILSARQGGWTRYSFDGWWSETGNAIELAVATRPGLWRTKKDFPNAIADYVEVMLP